VKNELNQMMHLSRWGTKSG